MPPGFDYPGGSDFWTARELNPPQTLADGARLSGGGARVERRHRRAARTEISALSRMLKQRHGDATWMFDAAAVPLARVAHGHVSSRSCCCFRRRDSAPRDRLPQRLEPAPGASVDAAARARPPAGRSARTAGRLTPPAPRRGARAGGRRRASSASRSPLPASGHLPRCSRPTFRRIADVRVDAGVLGFALLVAVGTAALARRPDVAPHFAHQAARVARRRTTHDGRRPRRARAAGTRRRAGRR